MVGSQGFRGCAALAAAACFMMGIPVGAHGLMVAPRPDGVTLAAPGFRPLVGVSGVRGAVRAGAGFWPASPALTDDYYEDGDRRYRDDRERGDREEPRYYAPFYYRAPEGERGDRGNFGDRGERGNLGDRGNFGDRGERGNFGDRGDSGDERR